MPAWKIRGFGYVDHNGAPIHAPSQKAFIWPKDRPGSGRRRRILDLVSGKGPDIFIASNPNRKPGAIDGPSRRRWTGWAAAESNPIMSELDRNNWEGSPFGQLGWGKRASAEKYDFKRRRYTREYEGTLTDVRHDPLTKRMVAAEHWPYFNVWFPREPLGNMAYFDPRNFNAGGLCGGPDGEGGYFHPAVSDWALGAAAYDEYAWPCDVYQG